MLTDTMLILSLCSLLGSDNFQTRSFAHKLLENSHHPAIFMAQPQNHEATIRLKQLQRNYKSYEVAKWFEQNKTSLPWIPYKIEGHWTYLYDERNKEAPDDNQNNLYPKWRYAAALYLKEILEEDLDYNRINRLIENFQLEEDLWLCQTHSFRESYYGR